jgi:hypothetical protein
VKKRRDDVQRVQVSRAPLPIKPLRAYRATANPEPTFDQKPDWAKWANMPTCELWQAVALSLDLEPDALPRASLDEYPDDKFRQRLRVACVNFDNTRFSEVIVSEFRAWALSLPIPWTLPDRFPPVTEAAEAAGISLPKQVKLCVEWLRQRPTGNNKRDNLKAAAKLAMTGITDRDFHMAYRIVYQRKRGAPNKGAT